MATVAPHFLSFPAFPAATPIVHSRALPVSWLNLAGNSWPHKPRCRGDQAALRLPAFLPPQAAISARSQGTFDPELRAVLELATDAELFELEGILFGPSYFSPLLKSITNKPDVDYIVVGEDLEGREDFIAHLESRFLFLAADAGSTLRGSRPSYRNVLLAVRRKLGIPCSSRLSTEDLEVEIFLQLLHEFSSPDPWDDINYSSNNGSLEVGLDRWKVNGLIALRDGAKELQQMIMKGGCMLALTKIYNLLARKLSGKMLLEVANYEIKHEILKRGGQLAIINLESRAALLAARQGIVHAVSRSLGLRSMMMLLGPILWGTFLADVVIQMLGIDYARILRAIYAFAQVEAMLLMFIFVPSCDDSIKLSQYIYPCSDPPLSNIWLDV